MARPAYIVTLCIAVAGWYLTSQSRETDALATVVRREVDAQTHSLRREIDAVNRRVDELRQDTRPR